MNTSVASISTSAIISAARVLTAQSPIPSWEELASRLGSSVEAAKAEAMDLHEDLYGTRNVDDETARETLDFDTRRAARVLVRMVERMPSVAATLV